MGDLPYREKSNDRRVGTWLLLGLVIVIGGLYVAGYLFTGDRVPRGTTIAGVDVGGMRPAAASHRLAANLETRVRKPIVVSAEGRRMQVDPADAGLSVAYDESVAQAAAGRSWSPAKMIGYLVGGTDHEPVVHVDEEQMRAAVARIAKKVDQRPKEGGIRFRDGRAIPQMPQTGVALDQEAAEDAVTEAFMSTDDVVPLPVSEVKADVTRDEVQAAMGDFANPAMSGPVILEIGTRNVVVRPSRFSAALSMDEQNGQLVPRLDRKRLLQILHDDLEEAEVDPKPATVRLVEGEPRVVRGSKGLNFKRNQITDQFLSLVVQRGKHRTLEVRTVEERPKFGVRDARKLRIREVVSSFTTYFPHSDYRNTNLGRAAELISGTVLRPGETFSLNDVVGERTAANGFVEGYIISNGVYKEDFGGGVSQVATTTFNAAFFAGLEDVEHHPHSFYISRYPLGREATVAWGALDLQFRNDTPYGVLVEAWIEPSSSSSQGEMHVRMWSSEYWDIKSTVSDRYDYTEPETRYIEAEECVPNEGYRGFSVDVYRHFYRHGSDTLHHKERMHTVYTPSDTVVCGPEPSS